MTAEISIRDEVAAPRQPAKELLRDFYFPATERLTLGLVRFRQGAFRLGPLTLIRFGDATPTEDGWRWELKSGELLAKPGGSLEIGWRSGRLFAAVSGYRPALPAPVYRWTQRLFHHFQTRVVLLRMRGRVPETAPPATPAARLAAAAIDAGVCLLIGGGKPRKTLAVAAGYHLAAWALGGYTAGGVLLGQRVVAVDGSPLTLGQAALRLAALPLALFRLRAIHDEVAGTEVVRP